MPGALRCPRTERGLPFTSEGEGGRQSIAAAFTDELSEVRDRGAKLEIAQEGRGGQVEGQRMQGVIRQQAAAQDTQACAGGEPSVQRIRRTAAECAVHRRKAKIRVIRAVTGHVADGEADAPEARSSGDGRNQHPAGRGALVRGTSAGRGPLGCRAPVRCKTLRTSRQAGRPALEGGRHVGGPGKERRRGHIAEGRPGTAGRPAGIAHRRRLRIGLDAAEGHGLVPCGFLRGDGALGKGPRYNGSSKKLEYQYLPSHRLTKLLRQEAPSHSARSW